jgi:multiple sugar transport system permease protein
MWSFLLLPHLGAYTRALKWLGLGNVDFFSSRLILPTILLIVIWEWTGYNMMILYTALKSVPRDIVEAAIIDGAPLWRIILRVKLPMVRPAIVMLVFLNTIGALQLFTEPQILEYFQQGSVSVNYTPSYYIWNTAIAANQTNLAAAMAVILAVIVVVISALSLLARSGRRAGARRPVPAVSPRVEARRPVPVQRRELV